MSNWQPIETAPRDAGGIILGSTPVGDMPGWSCEGYWCDHSNSWMLANIDWTDHHAEIVYPTHWQPLPGPPEG